MAKVTLEPLAPSEALQFFREKGFAEQLQRFDWRDVWQEEHARAFVVAKAMRLDVLGDIRAGIDRALAEGRTFEQFRADLEPLLRAKGWWGKQAVPDPVTGEIRPARLGSPRRLRVIFDTNLRMSQAAGRWARIQRLKASRPFLRYVAVLDSRTRPEHSQWHGTVLPVDHAWWHDHYPPNGWNCRCIVQQLSARDLRRQDFKVSEAAPPSSVRRYFNRRTDQEIEVPAGIDPGFAYNVGKAWLRGNTPKEIPGIPTPPTTPAPGLPPLPAPRASTRTLLSPDLSIDEYLTGFLQEFGATPEKPVVFRDVIGEAMIISDELFRTERGFIKLNRDTRRIYLPILAETIKSPDEIWITWARLANGTVALRRRYLARWHIAGTQISGFSVFELGNRNWQGVTAFPPKAGRSANIQDDYLEKMRSGELLYRRKE